MQRGWNMAPGHISADDAGLHLRTARPKLRLRPIMVFAACFAVLAVASYFKAQPYRGLYGGLDLLGTFAMAVEYVRETALVRNSLSANAVVSDYQIRGKHAPYLGKGVPIIKYEFIAFDQKTYRGETGWGAANLQKGSPITVLYNPQNPGQSHPLGSFVFYSFKGS